MRRQEALAISLDRANQQITTLKADLAQREYDYRSLASQVTAKQHEIDAFRRAVETAQVDVRNIVLARDKWRNESVALRNRLQDESLRALALVREIVLLVERSGNTRPAKDDEG